MDDDEGITREELATVLSNALLSATAVLQSTLTQEEDKSEDTFEKVEDTVKRIVDNAFETCDTSRNGRLEIDDFVLVLVWFVLVQGIWKRKKKGGDC